MEVLIRKTFSADFDLLKSTLDDTQCSDINLWPTVESFTDLKELKKHKHEFDGKTGVYAIIDSAGDVAYIGKANCLYDRLSSHSKALVGGEEHRAAAWHQFFSWHNGKNLTARYFVIEGFAKETEELAKKVIERALQIKYRPYFDLLYLKKKFEIKNFEQELGKLKNARELLIHN